MHSAVLKDKTAIVTGAGSGIGRASAQVLAQDGAAVLIMGRTEGTLIATRAEILRQEPQARVEIFTGDACEEDAVKAAVEQAYTLSDRLDILVPVVGGPEYALVAEQDPGGMRDQFELNFMSAFLLIHHGLPLMQAGGTIVCISSAVVGQAYRGLSACTAAKAALERYVRAAAFELGNTGIRINTVRPGVTREPEAVQNSDAMAMCIAETPLSRIGEPMDIARVVRFLAGPESDWVTGETISADGGMQQGKAPDLKSAFTPSSP